MMSMWSKMMEHESQSYQFTYCSLCKLQTNSMIWSIICISFDFKIWFNNSVNSGDPSNKLIGFKLDLKYNKLMRTQSISCCMHLNISIVFALFELQSEAWCYSQLLFLLLLLYISWSLKIFAWTNNFVITSNM